MKMETKESSSLEEEFGIYCSINITRIRNNRIHNQDQNEWNLTKDKLILKIKKTKTKI